MKDNIQQFIRQIKIIMYNPLTSRTISTDKIYKKFSQSAYDFHKQRLQSIYTKSNLKKQREIQEQKKNDLKRLINNRKAYSSCHQKVNSKVKLENKALIQNIQQIINRRSTSEVNLNFNKNNLLQNKKKQIKIENKILVQKIALSKLDIADIKKNLLNQFQQYEDKKNMLRKLKQTSKPKLKSLAKSKSKSKSTKKPTQEEEKQSNAIKQNQKNNEIKEEQNQSKKTIK